MINPHQISARIPNRCATARGKAITTTRKFTLKRAWLKSYAYRIARDGRCLFCRLVSILLIAAVTVSFQILRTPAINPAKTLKYE